MVNTPTSVVWFRRDLRVADHPALTAASRRGRVVALFVVDPSILARRHHQSPERLRFLRAGVEALDVALRARGGALVVRYGDPTTVVPAVLSEAEADEVHVTRERSLLGSARDLAVEAQLSALHARLVRHRGDLLAEPDELVGSSGNGYLVFTPFHRAWSQVGIPEHLPAPSRVEGPTIESDRDWRLPAGAPGLPAGPDAARSAIVAFIKSGGSDRYPQRRDLVGEEGTSGLSAYLRFGMCTPAQVGRALGADRSNLADGRTAFWRQIAWRDFYHHLMARRPEILRVAQRASLRGIAWDNDARLLRAWADGETGVPMVDAGMRQLAASGWMHNRARMIVASYLIKDLLVDWRRGETHFMRMLVDGDPANNNGGWQWTAGTGADAAPYFRVFNPSLQGTRFDAEGDYVRRWVPEIRDVPTRRVHEPWTMTDAEQRSAGCRIGSDYPAPVVDHKVRRLLAIERYKQADQPAGDSPTSRSGAGHRHLDR